MAEKVDLTFASKSSNRHPAILRASGLLVGTILSLMMITAVVPPIVADQSDRAMVDAPVTLLTTPIGGEIDTLSAELDKPVRTGDTLARITNVRVDRGTSIA